MNSAAAKGNRPGVRADTVNVHDDRSWGTAVSNTIVLPRLEYDGRLLGATLGVGEAAEIAGLSKQIMYRAIVNGEVEVLRLNGRIRVRTRPLLELLGIL